jgi:predicted kinase
LDRQSRRKHRQPEQDCAKSDHEQHGALIANLPGDQRGQRKQCKERSQQNHEREYPPHTIDRMKRNKPIQTASEAASSKVSKGSAFSRTLSRNPHW